MSKATQSHLDSSRRSLIPGQKPSYRSGDGADPCRRVQFTKVGMRLSTNSDAFFVDVFPGGSIIDLRSIL